MMKVDTTQSLISGQKLVTIDPTARVRWAAKVMTRHNVGALPVVVGDQVIGIISERDILQRCMAKGLKSSATLVQDIMTPDPITIRYDEPITTAMELMMDHEIRHLPVECSSELICGMLSIRQVVAAIKRSIEIQLVDLVLTDHKFATESLPKLVGHLN